MRPNSHFSNGICIACTFALEDEKTSYRIKLKNLKNKIQTVKQLQRKKSEFDCIVGVSGGKDSTRQALWVRDRLQMRPLLVCVAYPPKQMSDIGAANLSNLINKNFDIMTITPAPKSSSRLTLEGFIKYGNVSKATEIALYSSVPRLAIDFDIKLIFWGENDALQVGDAAALGDDEFDGNNLRKINTLSDGGSTWIYDFLKGSYLTHHYIYPDEHAFEKNKINIFYLGAAWDDWTNEGNATNAALRGLTLRPGEEKKTGDISNASMLDEEFTNINMMLKYFKFGFGRATDFANELIRNGTWTREYAIGIVEQFDGVCADSIIESFCEYTDLTVKDFWNITNTWVNKSLFQISEGKRPLRKFRVGYDYNL